MCSERQSSIKEGSAPYSVKLEKPFYSIIRLCTHCSGTCVCVCETYFSGPFWKSLNVYKASVSWRLA